MRVLHTSDWHLGQKLIHLDRDEEHEAALEWLLSVVESEKIDAVILAGDVFDVNNPPAKAEAQYYRFLTRLIPLPCRHLVIIGGNHDSPLKLNAPAALLKSLEIHVIGCATDTLDDEMIILKDGAGQPEMLVCATPFLREKDFAVRSSGETVDARIERIKAGLADHYAQMGQKCAQWLEQNGRRIPCIATGHLHAKGAVATPEQTTIYIGNLDNITADKFPEVFDYVALGHIHTAQKIGGQNRIRYSGSLIPLSFSEINDRKCVLITEFSPEGALLSVDELPVPVPRKLVSLKGTRAEVERKLLQLKTVADVLAPWVEITVQSDAPMPGLDMELRNFARDLPLEILRVRAEVKGSGRVAALDSFQNLDDFNPEEVFLKRLEGMPEAEQESLLQTFRELTEWQKTQEL